MNFKLQNYKNINSTAVYDSLNLNDFRAENINLHLVAAIDISKNDFSVDLHNLSFTPNLTHFNLKDISGKLKAASNGLEADGLKILTKNSEINISAQMKGYDIFGRNSLSALKKSPVMANLNANVNLQDLGNFVSVFRNSIGNAEVTTKVSGVLGDIIQLMICVLITWTPT